MPYTPTQVQSAPQREVNVHIEREAPKQNIINQINFDDSKIREMLLVLNKRMEKSFKTQELKVTELDGKFQSLLEQLNSLKNVKIIKYKFDQMVYSRDAPLEKEVKTIVIKEIESVKMPEVKD